MAALSQERGHFPAFEKRERQEMTMPISSTTQEMLKVAAGRGLSNDPELLTRSKIRLLQKTSKLPRHGMGAPGLFVLPDEAATCVTALRLVPSILYTVFSERTPDDKYAGEHFILPAAAEKDGYRWRLPDGSTLDKESRLAGVYNGVEAEFDLAKTAMKAARTLNADAKARTTKLGLPFCGLAYALSSQELTSDRGLTYYGPAIEFVGAVGEPDGPTEEVLRASALRDIVESTIAEAKREATLTAQDSRRVGILPPHPRPHIESGRGSHQSPAAPTPPPVDRYDGPDVDSIIDF
jgi:hypothetical protein